MHEQYRKVVLRNIVRYLLGFFILFISSILVARTARESIRKYVIEQAETRVAEGISKIGENIEKMDLISQMMCKSSDFASLIYSRNGIGQDNVLKVRDSNNMLVRTGYVSEFTPYMFVLFQNNDLYLSSAQCSLNFNRYYDEFLKLNPAGQTDMDAEQIKTFLFDAKKNNRNFLKLDSANYIYDNGERCLDQTLLYLGNTGYTGYQTWYVFCFMLDREFLKQSILVPELEEKSFLYVQDRKSGEVLVTSGDVPEGVADCENGMVIGDEEQYRVIADSRNDIGWRVVTGVPNSFIEEQMEPVNRLLKGYLILGFFLMLVFTVYFSLERYLGFRKVMVTFPKEELETGPKQLSDEYGILHERVMHLHEKGKYDQMQIEELKRQNQAILVESMIVKGIYTEQERRLFEEKLGKEPDFFCVCVVHYLAEDSSVMEDIALDVRQSLRKNKVDVFTNVHSGAFDELYVIPLSPEQAVTVSGIQRAFENMVTEISRAYDVVLHVGISAIGTGMKNLNQCYEQARRVVQAQNTFENGNAVKCYDISVNALHENPLTLERLNHLYTLLVCGQQEDVERELRQLKGNYERRPYLYEGYKEQIFYSLRNIFFSVILHLNCEEGEKNIPVYNKDMGCREMIKMFEDSASWICSYILQKRKSKNERMKEKILACIRENFQNPGISAAAVSEEVGISEKYLAQFLKEQSGETFASCLLRLRIDRAKEYLQETDYSNEQIAELAGFGTVNTFYRNFKKIVGVTPNIYRENQSCQENTQ